MDLTDDLDDPDRSVALSATLYCRTQTSVAAAVDRYHSELAGLRSAGTLDDVEVVDWPTRVDLTAGGEVAAAYERFRSWAAERDLELAPAFSVRRYESSFTGEAGSALVTPVACLAVRVDGDLRAVYPHVEGDTVRTVEDGIADVAALADAGGDSDSVAAGIAVEPGIRPGAAEPHAE